MRQSAIDLVELRLFEVSKKKVNLLVKGRKNAEYRTHKTGRERQSNQLQSRKERKGGCRVVWLVGWITKDLCDAALLALLKLTFCTPSK
jgi:hypothetical protein